MVDGSNFYSGEMDGLYYNTPDGQHKKLNNTEKVITILKDRSGGMECLYPSRRTRMHRKSLR